MSKGRSRLDISSWRFRRIQRVFLAASSIDRRTSGGPRNRFISPLLKTIDAREAARDLHLPRAYTRLIALNLTTDVAIWMRIIRKLTGLCTGQPAFSLFAADADNSGTPAKRASINSRLLSASVLTCIEQCAVPLALTGTSR